MSTITISQLTSRARGLGHRDDGMATAEYAVGTVAACGMAGVLYKVVTSEAVMGLITTLFEKALDWIF